MGFCVASTKNGSGSLCVVPPTVTWRSCMASSRAAWVLGGVRLISSARMTLANSGPCRNLNMPLAGGLVFLQHLGAGDVGRHQVGRELDAAEAQVERIGQRADHQRLGQAGHADQQAWPRAKMAMSSSSRTRCWPTMALLISLADAAVAVVEAFDGRQVALDARPAARPTSSTGRLEHDRHIVAGQPGAAAAQAPAAGGNSARSDRSSDIARVASPRIHDSAAPAS